MRLPPASQLPRRDLVEQVDGLPHDFPRNNPLHTPRNRERDGIDGLRQPARLGALPLGDLLDTCSRSYAVSEGFARPLVVPDMLATPWDEK